MKLVLIFRTRIDSRRPLMAPGFGELGVKRGMPGLAQTNPVDSDSASLWNHSVATTGSTRSYIVCTICALASTYVHSKQRLTRFHQHLHAQKHAIPPNSRAWVASHFRPRTEVDNVENHACNEVVQRSLVQLFDGEFGHVARKLDRYGQQIVTCVFAWVSETSKDRPWQPQK